MGSVRSITAIGLLRPTHDIENVCLSGKTRTDARPSKWCFDPQRSAATRHLITSAAAASAAIDNARGMAKIFSRN
jgi:hypothetical protein